MGVPVVERAGLWIPIRPRLAAACRWLFTLAGLTLFGGPVRGADTDDAETLLRTGRYDECAHMAARAIAGGTMDEDWNRLKIQAELARGKNTEALATFETARRRFWFSVPLRLLGREVYRANGRADDAAAELDTIERIVFQAPQRFTTADGRIALGRFFLLKGADSRQVLEQFYDVAAKQAPDNPEVYLAQAELALEKQDEALAAETLEKAPKAAAENPRYHYLLARAYENGDHERAAKALVEALRINPKHVDSLLLEADARIDEERYAEAAKRLDQVLEVNPREPRAFAYRAVLAHLRSDADGEAAARRRALESWAGNPEVDHLIGRKLSQKYRFAEGAADQKKSLELDPDYLPAKVQLCQDLLRLGDEAEGWKLADLVFAKDGYNVLAYNLVNLRDRLATFRTLQDDNFVVRMDPREAELYGPRVLALLHRAKTTLCEKYGVSLSEPVIVEIFPQRKEFAVRTFGLPGAEGFLGVCFGRVVTANSPASQGEHPANWEAVLYHEFCHVVTLHKTRNKMPRWLSEGISVYEEEQADRSWATPLNPQFRGRLLADTLTPLSRLSSAFLGAKSSIDVQFAYFESALAVEFLVQRFGLETLNGLLDDLGAGKTLQDALPVRAHLSLKEIDDDFGRFARRRAEQVAPGVTWDEPNLPAEADSTALRTWLDAHPKSFGGRRRLAARLVVEEKWDRAKEAIETLRTLYPEYVGPENAYMLRAAVAKRTSDPARERAALDDLAARDGSAGAAYLRLMELDEAEKDWRALDRDARRMLAVNPLVAAPHRALARAAEELGKRDEAIAAYRAVGSLDDTDPADVHYRLARLLRASGQTAEARREVLKALEEAPRFLEAHRLLLELVETDRSQGNSQPR